MLSKSPNTCSRFLHLPWACDKHPTLGTDRGLSALGHQGSSRSPRVRCQVPGSPISWRPRRRPQSGVVREERVAEGMEPHCSLAPDALTHAGRQSFLLGPARASHVDQCFPLRFGHFVSWSRNPPLTQDHRNSLLHVLSVWGFRGPEFSFARGVRSRFRWLHRKATVPGPFVRALALSTLQ